MSQIISLTIVHSTVYSGGVQRKHQSSVTLAFVRGIYRWPVNSLHKWSVTRKTSRNVLSDRIIIIQEKHCLLDHNYILYVKLVIDIYCLVVEVDIQQYKKLIMILCNQYVDVSLLCVQSYINHIVIQIELCIYVMQLRNHSAPMLMIIVPLTVINMRLLCRHMFHVGHSYSLRNVPGKLMIMQ